MIDDKTHFVGVLPPLEIKRVVDSDRKWCSKYGCKSGHSTEAHVTLIPPFASNKSTKEIKDILRGILPLLSPFVSKVDGYGSFGNRTIYLRVEPSEEWNTLSRTLSKGLKAMGESVKIDKKALTPHLTVANRDIPPDRFSFMLGSLLSHNFSSPFPVDSVALFHREGGIWRIDERDILKIGGKALL